MAQRGSRYCNRQYCHLRGPCRRIVPCLALWAVQRVARSKPKLSRTLFCLQTEDMAPIKRGNRVKSARVRYKSYNNEEYRSYRETLYLFLDVKNTGCNVSFQ
jgi:hypothetical protein